MLNSQYDQENNVLTFTFSARLDTANSMALMPLIENKVAEHPAAPQGNKPLKVVFDLNQVDFISSTFIRICMKVLAKVKAGNLTLQNATPVVKKAIKIAGLENQLIVV